MDKVWMLVKLNEECGARVSTLDNNQTKHVFLIRNCFCIIMTRDFVTGYVSCKPLILLWPNEEFISYAASLFSHDILLYQ